MTIRGNKGTPLLEISNLGKSFGGVAALRDVSFSVFDSDVLGLIGPNGAGKSTLLNVINGFSRPTSGRILLNGADITALPPYGIAERGIGRCFQEPTLFMESSVFDNVFMAFHLHYTVPEWKMFLHTKAVRREESFVRTEAMEILEFMGLASLRDRPASSLSHGQQKTLGICMGLAVRPKLLLLDEPVTGMNPTETTAMIDLINKISRGGITIVLVEHNMKVVMGLCSRIIVLNYGSKIAEGAPSEILTNQSVIEAYLGRKEHAPQD